MQYKEQKFDLPSLDGLSDKQIEVHLGLYAGYVKHVNLCRELIHDLETEDIEKNAFAIMELRRRFSFEFDGMRMHEYYFEGFEGGAKAMNQGSPLGRALSEKYEGWDGFINHFKAVAMSRGVGWSVLYHDPKANTPHVTWVSDHEVGVLAGLPILLSLDMWEHAFMVDYLPSEKKEYVNAFFENLNWGVVEKRFLGAV